jgi:molecular chaperone DnaK (HSP70)
MKYMGSIDKCSILDADILPMEAALLILDFLIGIEIVGVMTKLIPRISVIPTKKYRVFRTYNDQQTTCPLRYSSCLVFQHMKFEHLL